MAATEACAGPVQGDNAETKAEVEPTNAESVPAQTEETQPASEAPQNTEQPADSKAKPASENIWGSFLNKSGLGKVMGGKKKKEQSTGAEDAGGEEQEKASAPNQSDQGEAKDEASSQAPDVGEGEAEGQAIDKAAENDEASQEQKSSGKDAKPKQGEKSSVRDFIRKPVARIFSHRSTEKKDGTGEVQKHGKVRSKSLDRLEDADASTVVVDQMEDPQAADEPDKSTSHATKHMKRWHSFKKLMVQKSHKKSTDDSKDMEGAEGTSGDAPGDTGTLDSKSDHTGQKRWKLKRSWTFQGLKRDPSVVGIHKRKDSSDDVKGEENVTEADQGATGVPDDSKADGETQDKTNADGDEERGATAATQRAKSVDQHANEIWTSFKKRVTPKSKKSADVGGGEEEPAGEQEQTDEQQAGKDSGKTAKTKKTHFNRAVSLKNFILRKGKSTSVDMGEGPAALKEGDGTGDADAKDTDGPADTAGNTDLPQGGSEDQAATQSGSSDKAEAPVADERKGADGKEKSLTSTPSGQQSDTPRLADPATVGATPAEPTAEMKANGENGVSDAVSEDAHNHETPPQNGGQGEEAKQDNTNSQEAVNSSGKTCPSNTKDGKILNQDGKCGTGKAVAQSGECDAEIDSNDHQQNGGDMTESKIGLGTSYELETGGDGPPQNGRSHSGSGEAIAEPDDQEEARKRMLYEVAASIVRTVVSAATEQLAKEKILLDSSLKCSHSTNNGNYPDIDVSYYH